MRAANTASSINAHGMIRCRCGRCVGVRHGGESKFLLTYVNIHLPV